MSAGKYSFVIDQGSTVNFEIQYKDSAGTPIDLNGYGARMQVRSDYSSNTILMTLSSSLLPDGTGLNMSGSSGTKPLTSGSIGIYISAATSSMMTFDKALYDLEIHSGSYVSRILQGQIKLSKEITR